MKRFICNEHSLIHSLCQAIAAAAVVVGLPVAAAIREREERGRVGDER